jgi:hypothetical protein
LIVTLDTFCHYQTHTTDKHIYTEKRTLRYRDRHEDERESTAREGMRERVRKTQREIPNTNVETLKTEQHMFLEC